MAIFTAGLAFSRLELREQPTPAAVPEQALIRGEIVLELARNAVINLWAEARFTAGRAVRAVLNARGITCLGEVVWEETRRAQLNAFLGFDDPVVSDWAIPELPSFMQLC